MSFKIEITDKEMDIIEAGLRAQQSHIYNKHMDAWEEGRKAYEDSAEFTKATDQINRIETLVQDLRLVQLAQCELPKFNPFKK